MKFSKIFRGSMPSNPLEPFLLSLFFKIILLEKNMLENMPVVSLGAPSLKQYWYLEFIADLKAFLKGVFAPFLGLTSLY